MRLLQSLHRIGDRANHDSHVSRSRRSQPIVSCESLETRALLSVLPISGSNLTVSIYAETGGDFPEEEVIENGVTSIYDQSRLSGIDIVTTGGTNTLNVISTFSTIPVSINLTAGTGTVNTGLQGLLGGNVSVVGAPGTSADVLNINDQGAKNVETYTITSSTVTDSPGDKVTYSLMGSVNINGSSSAADIYNIESTPAGTTVKVEGGVANDVFNVSPTAKNLGTIQGNLGLVGASTVNIDDQNNSASGTYSLASSSATSSTITRTRAATISYASDPAVNLNGGSGNDTYNDNGTPSVTKVAITGGSGTNTLVGPNTTNNWSITAKNEGTLNNNSVAFSGMENLTGGTGMDAFVFSAGGTVAGTINGGSGGNTLIAAPTTPTTVNLQTDTATGIGGFANIHDFVGSATVADTLVGANTTNTWTLNSMTGDTVNSIAFNGFANLDGGTGLDAFVFGAGATVTGKINGGGGGDWLDYAAYATPVTVNLSTGTATGVSGGIANIQNVRGGQGTDNLTGNSLGNILIGGAGTNTITGGSGRSILIGDKGKDSVTGGSDSDILIGGSTSYDSSTLANDTALESILAEWQSSGKYATRIKKIKSGVGPSSADKLIWGTTVFDNSTSEANTSTGAGGKKGANWFFANVAHTKTNRTNLETLN